VVICLERGAMIAYGPADATVTPSSLAPLKSRMFYLLMPAYPGCPGKRLLNGCGSSSIANMQHVGWNVVWYSGGSVPAVMSLANTDMQSTVPQISQKLDALRTMCQNLTHLWQVKKMKLEQCFQLRLFESDIEKVIVM